MFERIIEQRSAITAVLADRSVTKLPDERKLAIPDSHWRMLEDIIPVLKGLKCATTVLSTENNASSYVIYPVTHGLLANHLSTCDTDSDVVTAFKSAVSAFSNRRLTSDAKLITKIPITASALDPRHKLLNFVPSVMRCQVKERLLQLASQVSIFVCSLTVHFVMK